jgi:hypothetical protein
MSRSPLWCATLVAALACPAPARAEVGLGAREDPPRSQESDASAPLPLGQDASAAVDGEARTRAALARALDWLAAQQSPAEDGAFAAGGGRQNVPVPVAALAALAFMATGSAPDRGPHGRQVGLAVDYLLLHADLVPGSPTHGYIASEGDAQSRMHGHAFATIALAQAWSMSARTTRGKRLGEALAAAVELMQRSQGLEGAWMYEPRRTIEHENSVTVVIVQALRAARDAGVSVDAEVIARAVAYIRRCQLEDGSFRYSLGSGETSVALTAAGLTTLNSAGVYEGPEIDRAIEALWRRLGLREDDPDQPARFPFYERFYLAQALWQHSDLRLYERWVALERERVLAAQQADGSWHDPQFGSCYATAMNCLFLAIPDGLLPIFQR